MIFCMKPTLEQNAQHNFGQENVRTQFLASINLHREVRIRYSRYTIQYTLSSLRISMVLARHKIISRNHYLWFSSTSWAFGLIAKYREKYETRIFLFLPKVKKV
uniref:Uncharacterized protein n=1 Tax=Cacopsylla melanoneura TaxID=428564 RepID=A0A8D8U4P1_9HEMI